MESPGQPTHGMGKVEDAAGVWEGGPSPKGQKGNKMGPRPPRPWQTTGCHTTPTAKPPPKRLPHRKKSPQRGTVPATRGKRVPEAVARFPEGARTQKAPKNNQTGYPPAMHSRRAWFGVSRRFLCNSPRLGRVPRFLGFSENRGPAKVRVPGSLLWRGWASKGNVALRGHSPLVAGQMVTHRGSVWHFSIFGLGTPPWPGRISRFACLHDFLGPISTISTISTLPTICRENKFPLPWVNFET